MQAAKLAAGKREMLLLSPYLPDSGGGLVFGTPAQPGCQRIKKSIQGRKHVQHGRFISGKFCLSQVLLLEGITQWNQ
jgi:hypothetical protein